MVRIHHGPLDTINQHLSNQVLFFCDCLGGMEILKAEHVLTREAMDDIIDKLNHHGIDCVVLHKSIEIAGVIKGGI